MVDSLKLVTHMSYSSEGAEECGDPVFWRVVQQKQAISGLPTFDLLGIPFDKDGCGYCAYWYHLRKSRLNRASFQAAVRTWYGAHKQRLVWVASHAFQTCDCQGRHPNGGHFEVSNMTAFDNISYLQQGADRQRAAYHTLTTHGVLMALAQYDPILVGTIPINIDIESSDLDIICCWQHKQEFSQHLQKQFAHYPAFSIWEQSNPSGEAVIASFRIDNFEVEIFGQNIPTKEQYAYRHMIIEQALLQQYGEDFRQQVIALKRQGLKTEPAFAQLLGLSGDPYIALLAFEKNNPYNI